MFPAAACSGRPGRGLARGTLHGAYVFGAYNLEFEGHAQVFPAAACSWEAPGGVMPRNPGQYLQLWRVYLRVWVPCAGVPSSSVQWGAWSGVGMVSASRAVLARMQRAGIASVTPAAGLHVLSTLLACRTASSPQVHRMTGLLITHVAGRSHYFITPAAWTTVLFTP